MYGLISHILFLKSNNLAIDLTTIAGAIIVHRGQTYKITSMTRPPAFGNSFRSMTLGAYAKPCNHRYYTRPLSSLKITVVKQMERVDLLKRTSSKQPIQEQAQPDPLTLFSSHGEDASFGSFAGCGVVTVKRNVHGYKKMSVVTRDEISRSELVLPDMVSGDVPKVFGETRT